MITFPKVAHPPAPTLVRVEVTARDARVFRDLYRFRTLSVPWLARVHFGGSEDAVRERMRKLIAAGYVVRCDTAHREFKGYRLTAKGRRHIGVTKRPGREGSSTDWHAMHCMTVAEVADRVSSKKVPGWELAWCTEQEIVDGALDWVAPRGFVPDGVVVFTSADGELINMAVEVELHEKSGDRYVKKLAWYRSLLQQGTLDRLRWYVPSTRVENAVRRALVANRLPEDGQLKVEIKPIDQAEVKVYGLDRLRPERAA